jgi:hypothetical protein
MSCRSCGSCTACCTVMGVDELAKDAYTACKHARGCCSIYNDRPQSCREFSCMWLQDPEKIFRNMERPDSLGVMFDVTTEDGVIGAALVAREVRPGAFNETSAKDTLERLAKRVLVILVERNDTPRRLIGPEDLVKVAKRSMLRVVKEKA